MPLQEQHPAMHHYQNHVATPNIRRYPTAVPSLDPSQIQMYPAPPQMYTAQNAPCYTCLTVPVAGMQNRYSRYIPITSDRDYRVVHMERAHVSDENLNVLTCEIQHRVTFPGAMLNTCTAWRSCKRYGSTPRAVDIVPRAAVPTAPAAGHRPKRRRPHRGSVAPITTTSCRP